VAEQDQVSVGQLGAGLQLCGSARGLVGGEGFDAGGIDPRHLDSQVLDGRLQVVASRTCLGADQGRRLLTWPIGKAIWLG
jgi:hypothetical protein